jgi:hypothetical protein
MKNTYCTPASAHRGDVVTVTLQGKNVFRDEITAQQLGSTAAGCGLSFGL